MAGYVQMVREVARANGQITRKEVRDMLGKESRADHVIWELMRQGSLQRIARGVYRYVPVGGVRGKQKKPRDRKKERLIRRAMLISERFTAQDIATACDVTDSYVYRLIRRYAAQGWLRRYGKRESESRLGQFERVWRVTLKGREALKLAEENNGEIEIDPLAEATAELCRLVMLGLVQRREEDRKRALELCEEIKLELEGGHDDCASANKTLPGQMDRAVRIQAAAGRNKQDTSRVKEDSGTEKGV